MKPLDQKTLNRFLMLAGDHLTGAWVLMGGTVLPLLGIEHRTTTDIDLVGLTQKQNVQTLQLMELAEKLNLPVECINQAAAYFLQKVHSFKEHLVPLHEGKTAIIYRPDLFLYIALKVQRLSQSDLQDCLSFIDFTVKQKEPLYEQLIAGLIQKELKSCKSQSKIKRLQKLLSNF